MLAGPHAPWTTACPLFVSWHQHICSVPPHHLTSRSLLYFHPHVSFASTLTTSAAAEHCAAPFWRPNAHPPLCLPHAVNPTVCTPHTALACTLLITPSAPSVSTSCTIGPHPPPLHRRQNWQAQQPRSPTTRLQQPTLLTGTTYRCHPCHLLAHPFCPVPQFLSSESTSCLFLHIVLCTHFLWTPMSVAHYLFTAHRVATHTHICKLAFRCTGGHGTVGTGACLGIARERARLPLAHRSAGQAGGRRQRNQMPQRPPASPLSQ